MDATTTHGMVTVPWGAWYQDQPRTFSVPASWRVTHLQMQGARALTPTEIAAACDRPIDAPGIEALVDARTRVAIAVDDLTRPTPVAPVVNEILDRLATAGVKDDHVTIVIASGAHRSATSADVARKLGAAAGRARVVPHDPHGPLANTGVCLAGIEVCLNQAFYDADVRIGVCGVIPHPFAAFSGGGKIVVPGLSNLDVLVRTHKYALMRFAGSNELQGNRFRTDMEAAVRAIGLHWTANIVVNAERLIAFLAVGDLVGAHRAAAAHATLCGQTSPPPQLLDALFLNAYPKDGELLQIEAAFVALRNGILEWLAPNAPVVLMAACPERLGHHDLFGPGGRLFRVPTVRAALAGRPLFIYSPAVSESEVRSAFWSGYPFFSTWDPLIGTLSGLLPASPQIGVVPCGPLQMSMKST